MPQGKNKKHRQQQGHKGKGGGNGNKGKGGGKGKGKGKGPSLKQQRAQSLYDPTQPLTGKDLKKFVQAQVRLQTRPPINAAKAQLKTLQDTLAQQTGSLTGLGQQAQKNIGGYYSDLAARTQQSIAAQQAAGARLKGDVAGAGTQAAGTIAAAAQAANARLDESGQVRHAGPSSARDQLQSMIAAQQSGLARENQTLNATASGQASDWESMLRMQGQAAQQRGGEQMSDTQREITNRITELQQSYAPEIAGASSDLETARASKGDLRYQTLGDLRGKERDYQLAVEGLGIQKSQASSQLKLAKQYGKNTKAEQRRSRKTQLLVQKRNALAKKREQRRSLQSQLQVAQQQGDNKKAEQLRSRVNQALASEQYLKNKIKGYKAANKAGFGGTGKGKKGDSNTHSVSQSAITGYISENATKEQVQRHLSETVHKVLNRWPYLSRKYVMRVVKGYAGLQSGFGSPPSGDLSQFHQ